jgi:tripartite ATP-independent transporter DctP family solute receptor
LAVLLGMGLASSGASHAADKPVKWTFGDVYAADHAYTKSDKSFVEDVKKASNGQISIDYYENGQLGSEREMLEATRAGGQQLAQTSPGTLATLSPRVGTLELPYLFRDRDHYYKSMGVALSLLGEDLVAQTGLRVLTWRERTPRELTTNIPVTKLEDIKGLKIRVAEVPVRVALWKALGTNPTPLPMTEVYTSLATGAIDAQENPLDTIYSAKLYEQQKYVTLTDHMREIILILVNEKAWKALTPAQQKLIREAADRSSEMANKLVHEDEQGCATKLKAAGIKINTIDKRPFMERAMTIWPQFGEKEIYERIQAIK